MLLERSIQKTQPCSYKEKVQKRNRENTEKASIILVEKQCSEIKEEENFISIDIPNSNTGAIAQGTPIIYCVEEEKVPVCVNNEPFQVLPEASSQTEVAEELFDSIAENKEEEQLIFVSEDATSVQIEEKFEEHKVKHEFIAEQEEADQFDNSIFIEEIKAIQDLSESLVSEDPHLTISCTDVSDHLSVYTASEDIEQETTIIER